MSKNRLTSPFLYGKIFRWKKSAHITDFLLDLLFLFCSAPGFFCWCSIIMKRIIIRSPHVTLIESLPHGKKRCMSDRIALVIGDVDYQFVGKLNNPQNDANDIESVLHKLGFDFTIVPVFKSIANRMNQNISSVEARDCLLPRLMSGEMEV